MTEWIVLIAIWWTLATLPLITLGVASVVRWVRVVLIAGTLDLYDDEVRR